MFLIYKDNEKFFWALPEPLRKVLTVTNKPNHPGAGGPWKKHWPKINPESSDVKPGLNIQTKADSPMHKVTTREH